MRCIGSLAPGHHSDTWCRVEKWKIHIFLDVGVEEFGTEEAVFVGRHGECLHSGKIG